jgi:hypothetical protein
VRGYLKGEVGMSKKIQTLWISVFFIIVSSVAYAADPFPLKDVDVEYEGGMEMSMVQGEITNNSGKSYEGALFKRLNLC